MTNDEIRMFVIRVSDSIPLVAMMALEGAPLRRCINMQTLEYGKPAGDPHIMATILLVALPLTVLGSTFLGVAEQVDEPFMRLEARQIAIFGGSVALPIALAGVWFFVAMKRRLSWIIIVPVLVWFLFNFFVGVDSLRFYLREPWNQ